MEQNKIDNSRLKDDQLIARYCHSAAKQIVAISSLVYCNEIMLNESLSRFPRDLVMLSSSIGVQASAVFFIIGSLNLQRTVNDHLDLHKRKKELKKLIENNTQDL